MNHKLREVMTSDVEVIPPDCSIVEAAQKMKDLDVGVLPVCNGDKILGMVTDRDIAIKAVAEKVSPENMKVEQIMTSPVVYCYEDQDLEEAIRLMEVKQIRRLIVVDRNKKLVGIASLGDLAVKTGRIDLAGEALQKVSEPVKDMRPQ